MLRRACPARWCNLLPALCMARWATTTRQPVRAGVRSAGKGGAVKAAALLPKPSSVSRRQVSPARLAAGRKAEKQQPKKKKGASQRKALQEVTRNKRNVVTEKPKKSSSQSKAKGSQLRKGGQKGHIHSHAAQKKKYNKRVAAIAKLWRMQKKKAGKPSSAVSFKK